MINGISGSSSLYNNTTRNNKNSKKKDNKRNKDKLSDFDKVLFDKYKKS